MGKWNTGWGSKPAETTNQPPKKSPLNRFIGLFRSDLPPSVKKAVNKDITKISECEKKKAECEKKTRELEERIKKLEQNIVRKANSLPGSSQTLPQALPQASPFTSLVGPVKAPNVPIASGAPNAFNPVTFNPVTSNASVAPNAFKFNAFKPVAPHSGGYRATKKDKLALKKWRQGKSIGFTMRSSLKAKGLIPRANGTRRVSNKYRK